MKVCHILFCLFFLTAQEDGHSGRVNAETPTYRRVEGGSFTFECHFVIPGSRKFFCRGECENGNILIETTHDTFQSGRYSMKYVRYGYLNSDMYVSITQLKTSDSGRYRCSLDTVLKPDYFELIVTEASNTLTPDFTLKPAPTTTGQSPNFSSGGSAPSSASTELIKPSETPAGSGFLLLSVIVAVVVLVLMFLIVLTLIYKKRTKGSVVLDRRRNSHHNQTEIALYENLSPALTSEESVYQSLDPGSRDQDQTYSTLHHTK